MLNRRSFLKKSAISAAAFSVSSMPACICSAKISSKVPIKSRIISHALVAWYSQTGNTERHAKLLAKTLEAEEIKVTSSDLRDVDKKTVTNYQLIIIGSPVFYYDTPEYVKKWIAELPRITGVAVASYVTFGGPEGNQHNAACSIIEGLVDKGGVPIAINYFMNMGTYPPVWSGEKVKEHTWNTRHLPDAATYQRVREYGKEILRKSRKGQRDEFSKAMNLREFSTFFGPIWWTKQSIDQHYILRAKCIECGNCADKCPVGAIDLEDFTLKREPCVLCFGCLNNCPAQAVYMEYKGRRLIGYLEFMKAHDLKVELPQELKT